MHRIRCWIRQKHQRTLAATAASLQTARLIGILIGAIKAHRPALGSLEQTPNSCFLSLHLQWSPSTLRFRFTISSQYAATRQFSSVKFPRSWPTTWTWWDGSIPTAAATSPTHSHMVVKTEGMHASYCILPCKPIDRKFRLNMAHITERENWIDRPSYSSVLHALSTIFSFHLNDTTYHVCFGLV